MRGECRLALAGGVNVSIHPNKYLLLAQGRFASSKEGVKASGREVTAMFLAKA
jgi:polyketide synthase PksN